MEMGQVSLQDEGRTRACLKLGITVPIVSLRLKMKVIGLAGSLEPKENIFG